MHLTELSSDTEPPRRPLAAAIGYETLFNRFIRTTSAHESERNVETPPNYLHENSIEKQLVHDRHRRGEAVSKKTDLRVQKIITCLKVRPTQILLSDLHKSDIRLPNLKFPSLAEISN